MDQLDTKLSFKFGTILVITAVQKTNIETILKCWNVYVVAQLTTWPTSKPDSSYEVC